MALSRLDQLYRQVILDHSSHPHHYGELEGATKQMELNNPTCGDVIQIQLQLEGDRVTDARFSGSGCTISQASASMMTDAVIGKKVTEAMELANQFSLLVQGEETPNQEDLGDAAILVGVSKFPARIKCATLSWKAMQQALTTGNHQATEEQLHREEE